MWRDKRYTPLPNYISEKLSHKFVASYEKSMKLKKIWFVWSKNSKKIYKGKYKNVGRSSENKGRENLKNRNYVHLDQSKRKTSTAINR